MQLTKIVSGYMISVQTGRLVKIYKSVDDVKILEFKQHGDERGRLVVAECGSEIPFDIKRIFYIYGSDGEVVRGKHANKKSEFILVNVAGTSNVRVEDVYGNERTYFLDHPHMGLYLPAMVWKEMYKFSADSVLLCISSQLYDPNEYVRDYKDYRNLAKG